MIAERARRVAADIDTLQQLAGNARLRDDLEERRVALGSLVAALAGARRMMDYWAARGSGFDLGAEPTLRRAATAAHNLTAAFSEDVTAIVTGDAFSDTKRALEQALLSLSQRLGVVWHEYVAANEPHVREEQLEVLGRIRAFVPQVETIRRHLGAIRVASHQTPSNPQDVVTFDTAVAAVNSELQLLQGDASIPAEALSFVRACTSADGALLEDLTPVVRLWLQEHDLIDSLRIHL
jgi:hypothetical protein